jgi:hypothetical protein
MELGFGSSHLVLHILSKEQGGMDSVVQFMTLLCS